MSEVYKRVNIKMPKPYVSICGVRTLDQAIGLRTLFDNQRYKSHLGALGFVTSTESLAGEETHNFLTLPALYPLLKKSSAVNVIHHCSRKIEALCAEVAQVLNYQEIYNQGLCRIVQLNNGLIEVGALQTIKEQFQGLDIVLSVDKQAMKNKNLIDEIDKRQQYLAYYLIDPSYGTGTPFDVWQCADIYHRLAEQFPNLIGGFAGGLSPETVVVVIEEIQKNRIHDFSLCVDTGVRGSNGCDLEKAEKYLINVNAALRGPSN